MSDNDIEYEGLSEKDKEALRKLRTRIQVENPSELTISAEINPKMIKKSEWFDLQAQRLAKELSEAGQPTDSTDINPSNFTEKVEELKGLKKLHIQASRDADPTSKHSSGTLTIEGNRRNDDNEGDSWDSVEDMVRDLFTLSQAGSKRQRAKSKAIIEKIHRKTWKGHEERNIPFKGIEIKGKIDPDTGKETGIIEMMNREFRKRERLKREKRNAED